MNRKIGLLLGGLVSAGLAAAMGGSLVAFGAASSLPSASVGAVTLNTGLTWAATGSPLVVRSNNTGSVPISAPASASYDSNSDTSVVSGCQKTIVKGTVTGSTGTITETIVTVTNQALSGTATDNNGNTASLSGALTLSGSTGTATLAGSLPVGPEGKTTVSATATASETKATETKVSSAIWNIAGDGSCSGTPTSTTLTSDTTATANPTGTSGSSSASYVVDLQPPVPSASVHGGNALQGGSEGVGISITGGSAGTAYTWTASTSFGSFTASGTFGNPGNGTGIAPNEVGSSALDVPCSVSLGTYDVTVTLNAVDLSGASWGAISTDAGTFSVIQGIQVGNQALVVGVVSADGSNYDFLNGFGVNNPGSEHTAQIIGFGGPCLNEDSANLGVATMTIPAGFAFDLTGKSPSVHVFMSTSKISGFDLHNPSNMTEVTGSLSKPALVQNSDGSYTAYVDLSGLGTIPTTSTIYMRAHTTNKQSAPSGTYAFTDTVAATAFNGDPTLTGSNSDSYSLFAPCPGAPTGFGC